MVGKAIMVFLESIGHMKLSISDHLFCLFACDTEERLRRTAWDVRVVAGDIDKEGFGDESNLWPPFCRICNGQISKIRIKLKIKQVIKSPPIRETCCTLACLLLVWC